jgi:dTDP-4-dehydrorhamnose reductase
LSEKRAIHGSKTPVLVTGAAGMLGSALTSRGEAFGRLEIKGLSKSALDVRDFDAVMSHVDWLAGGWIIHCAATVDVEGCARDPEAAREVIVEGSRNVARLAKAAGARMLYPQSFLTYDGATNPIPEDETPRPLSLYGRLKFEAERVVRDAVDDPLIIRMAGFFGGAAKDKNFVGRIIPAIKAAMESGQEVFEVGDRVWQPTWTDDLAFNSLALLNEGARGSYQMASRGEASFFEIAEEIVSALGWSNRIRVAKVSASAVSGGELGRRPDRAVLSCERLDREDRNLQRHWRPTLRAYLSHPFFDQYRLEVA